MTVVGAGGKTSTIIILVQEMISKRLLITTTTHFTEFTQFFNKEVMGADAVKIINEIDDIWQQKPKQKIVVGKERINYDSELANYKIKGISPTLVDNFKLIFSDCNILVEGDGSAGKPIKVPASYEPVVPAKTDILIPVLGMSGLGTEINDQHCHRLKQLRGLTDKNIIDQELIVKILTSVDSYGYYQKKIKNYIPILNQVSESNLSRVKKIAFDLVEKGIPKVIITNTLRPNPVLKVVQR
ncbi:selenium cofactor biosynthesis protein YqeC [Sporohalobacter salinus]|uniref:selenium cofactor biosynthesis protein YqeC n=1 Tax=Sporohalobacter salinus TaxID=1494606 RepID=UPI0030B82523